MLYCFQKKGSGALLFSGEGNWCSTVLNKKETGAGCYTVYVFRRMDLVLYFSQEKEYGALMFSRRRKLVLYCFLEKGTVVLLFSGERN